MHADTTTGGMAQKRRRMWVQENERDGDRQQNTRQRDMSAGALSKFGKRICPVAYSVSLAGYYHRLSF